MKCSFCGFEFQESDAVAGCSGCALMKNCGLVRCPNCNFETVPEPEWIRKLKVTRRKHNADIKQGGRDSGSPLGRDRGEKE